MTQQPIVELSGVSKNYGQFTALHATDLEIGEGEFVTLLGPSGCGKTTTLRLIAGFEFPDTGAIGIAGKDVTAAPPYHRPVNTVFQDYALFPHMTVAENIGYGLSVKAHRLSAGERTERVREALEMVGLETMEHRMPGALSGGQRQRVAMARAIVRRPKLLLLDEPLSALDVKLREGMQVELKRLHRELGITFLMVTHDQAEALALSDRIVVMDQGRIAQIGRPFDLYDNPKTPYVADFIGATNLVPATYVRREGAFDLVALAGGLVLRRLARDTAPAYARNQPLVAGIRPERVQASAAGDANAMATRVVETLFQGDRMRLELLPEGERKSVFADIPRTGVNRAAISPGQAFQVFVDPADVMLFEAGKAP